MTDSNCPYLVGVAEIDVTPAVGSKLAGFADRVADSTGVYLPLRSIVTAITDRETERTVIMVSIEWLGFSDWTDRVRKMIHASTDVPTSDILLCGTHTHCGPPIRKHIKADCRAGGVDEAYLQASFAKVADTAKAAMEAREPVAMRSNTGWCGFAHSRRRPDGKGGVEWMPTLDAPHDHTVPMVAFDDAAGKLRHVLFGYTAHTSAAGLILEFGGDYAGFALREIEQQLECTCAFFQGCAGDQKPYLPDFKQKTFPAYPISDLQAMGRQLASAVVREINHGMWQNVSGNLEVRQRVIDLQTTVLPKEEYEPWLQSDDDLIVEWAQKHVDLLDRDEKPQTKVGFEIQTIQFGHSLVLIAMSGEMTAEYGLRIRKELGSQFGLVWPMGYANAMRGYICSERQIPEGGYEVFTSMQYNGNSGPYESGTEEQIVSAIHESLTSSES